MKFSFGNAKKKKKRVLLSTNNFVTIVFLCQHSKRWFDRSTTKSWEKPKMLIDEKRKVNTNVKLSAMCFPFECYNPKVFDHLNQRDKFVRIFRLKIKFSFWTFELFSSENQTLLIRRNSFFILNLCFDIFDRIRSFDLKIRLFFSIKIVDFYLECDRFSGQSLKNENFIVNLTFLLDRSFTLTNICIFLLS